MKKKKTSNTLMKTSRIRKWGLVVSLSVALVCAIGCVFFTGENDKEVKPVVEEVTQVKKETREFRKRAKYEHKHDNGDFFFHAKPRNRDVTVRLEDRAIIVSWALPAESATLVVKEERKGHYNNLPANIFPNGVNDAQNPHAPVVVVEPQTVKGTDSFRFTDGEHGKKYNFTLKYTESDGTEKQQTIGSKFLDFNKLPELETFFIDTEDGKDPTFEYVKRPANNLFGVSIKNNEYKQAVLNKNIKMKMRVRGNASAFDHKRSYKIVLEEKKDLLGLGEEYADREWILIGRISPHILQTYFGFHMGSLVGMEWQPHMRLVNLMFNGEWMGLYVLCESIKPHDTGLAIKPDGFIIESDGYFWKETGAKIKSPLFVDQVQYTFKYPKPKTTDDEQFLAIEKRIKTIEKAIESKSENVADLIDFDSFATWALAQEIMGSSDTFGTNRFFYQYDMQGKLKMGPLWDFDAMVMTPVSSPFWTAKVTYIPYLMEIPGFKEAYKQKYLSVIPTLEENIDKMFDEMLNIPGIEESWQLENHTMWLEYEPLSKRVERFKKDLKPKIEWLKDNMKDM